MRCCLIRGGHYITAAENLEVKSDDEALEKCKALFEERKSKFAGFEVWDGVRKLAERPRREDDGYADG